VTRFEYAQFFALEHYAANGDCIAIFHITREGGDWEDDPVRVLRIYRDMNDRSLTPRPEYADDITPFDLVSLGIGVVEFMAISAGHKKLPPGWDLATRIPREPSAKA
jgi:hypothetical protein